MKPFYQFLLIAFLALSFNGALGQTGFNITGTVTNDKNEPVKGAIVFIGGSERITATNDEGRFKFNNLLPGTFQLSVQQLGYAPATRNIILKNASVEVDMKLYSKAIGLNQVRIGRNSAWENNLKRFKDNFLGTSANARQCIIVNPQVINFSTKKGLLLADADDFLIIENKRLGYRLKYQLEDFGLDTRGDVALYHGQFTFEDLPGTDEQKKTWAKNRLATYQGSLMHFLRSVYANKVLENGFIARYMYGYGTIRYDPDTEDPYKIVLDDRQVKFDSLVATIDTSFKSLKFKQLYLRYDPQKAATYFAKTAYNKKTIIIDNSATILKLGFGQAVIDKKGSYTDYRDFFIQGDWAKARVADQLPVEYQPPIGPLEQNGYPTDKLVANLQRWTDTTHLEKLYLQMDKPCYAHGDTIWFKGYLTTGSRHELSSFSGAVYVDLIDAQNKLVKSLKLPVVYGIVAGDFELEDNMKDGDYRIRAYTQWMRNAGEAYFFDHTFTIGDPFKDTKNKTAAQVAVQQTDVQFFPEGGNLVSNLPTKVGFKAVGTNELGVAINGKVTDNDNNEVAQITTLHAGMGNFLLKPLPGKTYTAKVNFADGSTKSIALPKVLDTGYVLNIYQPNKDSVLVRIRASAGLKKKTIYLVVHTNGEVITALPVVINETMSSIWLEKKAFPSGVAQFTLFNTDNEPLNERIAFIKSNDRMSLSVNSAKPVYKSREHVTLNLTTNDGDGKPTAGNFGVAVIDEGKIPVDESAESTIFSNLLLKSDLKGYIEQPNYYFTADTDAVNNALDNLMLTQGYRRFKWAQLDSLVSARPLYAAESLATEISGQVTTLTHQPVANAKLVLLSGKAGFSKIVTADAEGKFSFDKMLIADNVEFSLQGIAPDNKTKVMVIMNPLPEAASLPSAQITRNKNQADADIIKINLKKAEDGGKNLSLSGNHLLSQVNINAQKAKIKEAIVPQGFYKVPESSVDKVITIPDPDSYNNLTMFMRSSLQGIMIQDDNKGYKRLVSTRPTQDVRKPNIDSDPFYGKAIGLIVDGRKITDAGEMDRILEGGILPGDVAKIEIVNTNRALVNSLQGMDDTFVGYVLLLTKLPSARKIYDPSIVTVARKGFSRSLEFYSPKYEKPADAAKTPDYRTTIYWNPNLNVDASGKTTLDFYNADTPTTYRVIVEGINGSGQIGRTVYTYKVE